MISAWQPIADGRPGIRRILEVLTRLKEEYGRLPAIRSAALAIASSAIDDDQAGQVNRLAVFVRTALIYVRDPLNLEFVQTPDLLLLAIDRDGFAQGDCDDHVLLFAALAESLAIECDIAGVCSPGAVTEDHVIAVVHLDGVPIDFDLCAKGPHQPAYASKLIVQ